MAKFEKSRWADTEFSKNYRDEADIYLPYRQQFIDISKSLYGDFLGGNSKSRVLDLGCGDGLFIEELLHSFSPSGLTLVDGSAEMLAAARERLKERDDICFIQASFQSLPGLGFSNQSFDFIYSSLAIHHLSYKEKKDLYSFIYDLLAPGGCFVNYDVVLPPSAEIEDWYLSLWRQWIGKRTTGEKFAKLRLIPDQYRNNPDNLPDALESQLAILEVEGFRNVDCYFKCGIFSLFGGMKEEV